MRWFEIIKEAEYLTRSDKEEMKKFSPWWHGWARYNTSGRTWRKTASPPFYFQSPNKYEAERFIKSKLPKSARNIEVSLKQVERKNKEVDQVEETASAGATGAGAIASVVGGLGAGDPKASIYYSADKKKKKKKKPVIIRRPAP